MDLKLVGKKVFIFPETGFFFAGFRVVTVCPGGLGNFFFPSNWYFSIFFAFCSLSGQVSLTSNAPCLEWGPCSFGRVVPPLGQTNRQTFYSRSRLVKGVLCALKNVLLPVAYIDGVEEIVNLTNFWRCSYLFGSKGPLFGPDAINPFKSSLLLR